MKISRDALLRIVAGLLRPVLRLCLKHSLRIQDISSCVRHALLTLAKEQLEHQGEQITASRLSIITGLHRREISRLTATTNVSASSAGLVASVMGAWQTSKDFTTAHGTPRVLSSGFVDSQFSELVRRVSKDLNPATVLFELERTGAVETTPRGVKLLKQSYVPAKDAEAGFTIAAEDVEMVVSAVEENISSQHRIPNLHARTQYDRIRLTDIEALRAELVRAGHRFHAEVRDLLAKHDQDVNPVPSYDGGFAEIAVGAVSHIRLPGPTTRPTQEKNDDAA